MIKDQNQENALITLAAKWILFAIIALCNTLIIKVAWNALLIGQYAVADFDLKEINMIQAFLILLSTRVIFRRGSDD